MNLEIEMNKIIDKCNISFEGKIISKEYLMIALARFFSNSFAEEKHNVGVFLHTGSICYDVALVVLSA